MGGWEEDDWVTVETHRSIGQIWFLRNRNLVVRSAMSFIHGGSTASPPLRAIRRWRHRRGLPNFLLTSKIRKGTRRA